MHFITFSRQLGTNGGEIAKISANRLTYRLVDTATIDRKAQEMGFLNSVEKIDEKLPSLLKRVFSLQPNINLYRLNSIIYEFGKQGNTVFLGRGGHILLKNFGCALHVRVVASLETRVRNLIERGYEKSSAEQVIEMSDHDRGGFMRFAFCVNWSDSQLYDLVLNTDKISIDSAAETVVSMANSGAIKDCSKDALDTLGRLAITSRAEAAIMEAGISFGLSKTINISTEGSGAVQLSGYVYDEGTKSQAEDAVKAVNGVEGVVNQIQVLEPEIYT